MRSASVCKFHAFSIGNEVQDLTNVEIATIVAQSITFDCEEARRMLQEENNKETPPARTLRHWKDRFNVTHMPVTSSVAACLMRKKDENFAAFADELIVHRHHNAKVSKSGVTGQRESDIERKLPPSLEVQVSSREPYRRVCKAQSSFVRRSCRDIVEIVTL